MVNVRVEAIRSLAELGAAQAVPPLIAIADAKASDPNLRLEAVTALGQLRAAEAIDLLIEAITDPWPTMRAAAFIALARIDPDTLLSAVSGLDADRHWSVRAALATALGTLDAERAPPAARWKCSATRISGSIPAVLVSAGRRVARRVRRRR